MRACLCLVCDLRPTNHDPAYDTRHIGERIRGCVSAVVRVCNMIEVMYSKLKHTYADTRRLSGMPRGRWYVDAFCIIFMFSVFRIRLSLLEVGLGISRTNTDSQ